MPATVTVNQVVEMASGLSPLDKLKVIERLTPNLADALAPASALAANQDQEDDIYQAGYRNLPEDIADVKAILPHQQEFIEEEMCPSPL